MSNADKKKLTGNLREFPKNVLGHAIRLVGSVAGFQAGCGTARNMLRNAIKQYAFHYVDWGFMRFIPIAMKKELFSLYLLLLGNEYMIALVYKF